MKQTSLLIILILALKALACYHGYESRFFVLETNEGDNRLRLIDGSHRLLIETRSCRIAVTPAYEDGLVFWVEEDPMRPCDELMLLDLELSGTHIKKPISFMAYSYESSGDAFPFTFKRAANVYVNAGLWQRVPEKERRFEANIRIQVDGEPIRVAFWTASIEPKWIVAKKYWPKVP